MNRPKCIASLLVLLGLFVAPAIPAQESLTEWGDKIFRDGQTVLSAPLHWQQAQWEKAAGLVAITGTLMATADKDVADYHDRHRLARVNDIMQSIDDVLSPLQRMGAYGAASLVTYSRVYQSDHWLSDVMFGAGLSYGVGAALANDDGKDKKVQTGWWLIPAPSGMSLSRLQTW